MGLRKEIKMIRERLSLFEGSDKIITLLREEIKELRLMNSELHDRLMSKNYEEFTLGRELGEFPQVEATSDLNYDSFVGTIGDLDKKE